MNGNEPIGCGLGAGRASGKLQVSCKCERRGLCRNSDLQEEEKVPSVISAWINDVLGRATVRGPPRAGAQAVSLRAYLRTTFFLLTPAANTGSFKYPSCPSCFARQKMT